MPRLSIIIPTLGNWKALEDTLVSVLPNCPPHTEVIVVHNGVYEDPYDLKDEVRFVEAPRHAQLVDLINAGVRAARSELIHLLPCGAVVDDGWAIAAVRHFADSAVGAVAPVVLDINRRTRLVSAGCEWSPGGSDATFATGRLLNELETSERWAGPDSAVAFYRRSSLSEIGLFDATLSSRYAAIDLSLRLIRAGQGVLLEATSHVFIEPSLSPGNGPFRQAWQCERLFWRHARKQGWIRSLSAHAWLLASETLKNVPRPGTLAYLAGHLVGACDVRGQRLSVLEPLPGDAVEATGPASSLERRVDQRHVSPAPPSRAGKRPSRTVGEARSHAR